MADYPAPTNEEFLDPDEEFLDTEAQHRDLDPEGWYDEPLQENEQRDSGDENDREERAEATSEWLDAESHTVDTLGLGPKGENDVD